MALTDDLKAYFKLNEASGPRNDSHGTNHLTDNNTVLSGTGKINSLAADFDSATADFLSITDNPNLSVGSNSDFTIACWLKTTQAPSIANLVMKHNDGGDNSGNTCEYNFWLSFARPRFTVGNNTAFVTAVLNTQVHDDAWHYIVVWHSFGDGKVYIQLDNGTPAEAVWTGGTYDGGNNFALSSNSGGSTFSYDGLMGDVAFYKRSLTGPERTELWNGGAGKSYDTFAPTGPTIILMGDGLT